ncbi:integrin alpha-4 [Cyprinodon tularosa]|uniref:integrin alpha-4 n=1 Tax=Cyprinodon tularosa TaxID=77115 RepID=UPI0018E27A65|nr:integrin alpha-4 [Cyprinodon tularosa]
MKPSGGCVGFFFYLVLVLFCPAAAYNLDLEHSLVFNGPSSSMFGYSVLLHRHYSHKWLVVGAPVANSSSSQVQSPGAVYRCSITAERRTCYPMPADVTSCGKTCEAESDHQWLGVSLSRQSSENGGLILACAHRWKNVFYSRKDSQNNKLPNGVCYQYTSDLSFSGYLIPCYKDHQRKFGEYYGSCQAGISNVMTQDLIIMGAPGTSYWTGSVLAYNTSSGAMSVYLDDETGAVSFGSYLGYAVGAGHFLSPSSMEVVGGAPQFSQKGKVFIFSIGNDNMMEMVSSVTGKELGSYFGSSVCVVDLNADGLSDLLVGAPMATGTSREEGRVHVYINEGKANLKEMDFTLMGNDAYAARFGQTIAELGDLDDDGYPDVAVGAPQEDELKGAVYIYNGRKEGISQTPSQRISGSSLGHDLRMFGQSLNSGIDIDDNGYKDVAVGAFLSDSAVVLRTRPVIQVKATLILPEQVDQQAALCQAPSNPTVCLNITICFHVTSKHFKGAIELQYNLTSDILHKPSFPHRFYFHGNGSSNSTRGHLKARPGHHTCVTHVVYQRKDVKDIYTPIQFEVSFQLKEKISHRSTSKAFPPLKPILQQSTGDRNTVTNQTQFARFCSLVNCSTNMQLSSELVLPGQQSFFALGSGQIILKTSLLNAGDDAFLPRMTLRFPNIIHFIKVLNNQDNVISCDVTEKANATDVSIDCGITSLILPASSQINISFLFDVNQNSTPGDINIHINTSSANYEMENFLQDNSLTLVLPLKYGVSVSIHGFVTPTSFVFGDEDLIPADCYPEKFNYTYKVINSGPSKAINTVVQIAVPKILAPHLHRLLQVIDLKSSHGSCSISDKTVLVEEDCNVPQTSFIKQLMFFFSPTSTRTMYCGRRDHLCEQLVCRLGNLEAGRDATIQLEISLNPAVLLQAPGRHPVMRVESTATLLSPREGPHTVLLKDPPVEKVVVEAVFTQKPSMSVKIFIVVVSLVLGLLILAALIWCLWKAGFFKRSFKKQEEINRDSWDYVPKLNKRESSI